MVLTKKRSGGGLSLAKPIQNNNNNNNFVLINKSRNNSTQDNSELKITIEEAVKYLIIANKKLKESVSHKEDIKKFSRIAERKAEEATDLFSLYQKSEEIEKIASEAKLACENANESLQKVIASVNSAKDAIKKALFIAKNLENTKEKNMIVEKAIDIANSVSKCMLISLKYNSSATLDTAETIRTALTSTYFAVAVYTGISTLNTKYMKNVNNVDNRTRRLTLMYKKSINAHRRSLNASHKVKKKTKTYVFKKE